MWKNFDFKKQIKQNIVKTYQLEANENNQNSSDYILNITLPNMLSG